MADLVVVRLSGGARRLFSVVKDIGGVDNAVAAHDEYRTCDARLSLDLWRHACQNLLTPYVNVRRRFYAEEDHGRIGLAKVLSVDCEHRGRARVRFHHLSGVHVHLRDFCCPIRREVLDWKEPRSPSATSTLHAFPGIPIHDSPILGKGVTCLGGMPHTMPGICGT